MHDYLGRAVVDHSGWRALGSILQSALPSSHHLSLPLTPHRNKRHRIVCSFYKRIRALCEKVWSVDRIWYLKH